VSEVTVVSETVTTISTEVEISAMRVGSSSYVELSSTSTQEFSITTTTAPLFIKSSAILSHRECLFTKEGVYQRTSLVEAGEEWLCFFHSSTTDEGPYFLEIVGMDETVTVSAQLYPTSSVSTSSLDLVVNEEVIASTNVTAQEITSPSEAAS